MTQTAVLRRLGSRPEFDLVLKGQVRAKTAHFVLHMAQQTPTDAPALGCILPKRWAKRAVTRNLIRRQIYGMAQTCLLNWVGTQASVVRLRTGFDPGMWISGQSVALRHVVRQELQELFDKARGQNPSVSLTKGSRA